MKTMIKYKSDDGLRGELEAACLKHERVTALIQGALAPLGPARPTDENDYVQHDRAKIHSVSNAVIAIIQREYPDESIMKYTTDVCPTMCPSVWHTWLGRYCDELTICRSLHRLRCINWWTGREYDQPYGAVQSMKALGAPGPGGVN